MPSATNPPRARRKRVTKNAQDRRADILRAGRTTFSTIGFAEATIADITRAADIATGTFYLYFDSKDHLLAALWERYVEGIVATGQQVLGRQDDWWPTIDRLLTALVDHAMAHAELHRIVYRSANAKALQLCKRSNEQVVDLLCDYVARGTAAGVFHGQRPTAACRMIYHAVHGLLDDVRAGTVALDTDQLVSTALELAHRTLGDAAPAARPTDAARATSQRSNPAPLSG